jgi:hypothetical protein
MLLLFLAGYFVSAVVLQAISPIPLSEPDSPLEFFTAYLLMILSLLALLLTDSQRPAHRYALLTSQLGGLGGAGARRDIRSA